MPANGEPRKPRARPPSRNLVLSTVDWRLPTSASQNFAHDARSSHAFVRNSLSCCPQIMANERAVPAAMEMMQIVQQTLFSTVRFMAISFEKGVIDLPSYRVSAWIGAITVPARL